MTDSVLAQAFVYLAAAVVFVPIAKRLGLGSVLGYLLAGVAIGRFGLGLVGHEGEHVMHFAEFGVVMMLFLVGLELQPSLLWSMRRPIFGLGGLQVVVTTAVLAAVGVALGIDWRVAVAAGLTLAMSSTAIVLSTLAEKALLKTTGGRAAFSVLLFQDVAVIPILAIFPLLAVSAPVVAEGGSSRPGWQQALLVLGAVAIVVGAGRFVVRPVLRKLAETRLRELFTAFALFLVVGIALLMTKVGLSPALGTFLAGVMLAESEYRHELEGDIEPFKGLLLGLFFISVGAEIDFALLVERPALIAGLVFGVMALKLVTLWAVGRAFGLDKSARWLIAFSLCQIGEFAFVLLSFGQQNGVFRDGIVGPLVASTAMTMLLTPPMFIALERWVLPRLADKAAARPHDEIEHEDNPVVLAGHGRVGQVIGRLLRQSGIGVTTLDLDPEMVDLLRRLGQKVYYGDASRLDLLVAAGCARAKLFILAVDDVEKSIEIAKLVQRNFPQLEIIARVRNRNHLYEMLHLGIQSLHRETLATSIEIAEVAMSRLGVRAHTAARFGRRWRQIDEGNIRRLAPLWGKDDNAFFAEARKVLADMEAQMRVEVGGAEATQRDPGWDNESLRDEVLARSAPPPTSDRDAT